MLVELDKRLPHHFSRDEMVTQEPSVLMADFETERRPDLARPLEEMREVRDPVDDGSGWRPLWTEPKSDDFYPRYEDPDRMLFDFASKHSTSLQAEMLDFRAGMRNYFMPEAVDKRKKWLDDWAKRNPILTDPYMRLRVGARDIRDPTKMAPVPDHIPEGAFVNRYKPTRSVAPEPAMGSDATREMELLRRERELLEREYELLKRERAIMQKGTKQACRPHTQTHGTA